MCLMGVWWAIYPQALNDMFAVELTAGTSLVGLGCDDRAGFSSKFNMVLSGDEPICPKFQPNIFDPSRCHDCLRQKHLHAGTGESTEVVPQQKSSGETGTASKTGTETGIGSGKGVFLTPIPSQAEERDTSSKEDSDGLSVVSSYCDVNGGRLGYQESSLCILSPDCELYICDGDGDDDDSTDSCREQSDYQEFSGSISTEDEYLPIRRHSTKLDMTRLDPPPHRPNPRGWMEEARTRDNFNNRSGLKEDKDRRESGYFSLGKAAGAHMLRDNSPPAPFRHYERGHPIFSSRNVEPKDTIPFRNPNLGVASERQIINAQNDDLQVEIPPPDPYDIAIEVEAQVGPRSPSPTPFKIAESLASTGGKGVGSSYGRRSPSSHVSSHQQSGRFDSSRQGSALQSRSSSPSRENLPFRRSESTASLSRQNFNSGGRTQGMETGSRISMQSTHGQRFESGTLPRNFKSFASSVKSHSSTVSDFRSALRKTDVSESSSRRGHDNRSSSPSRRDYNSSGQIALRNTEITSSLSNGCGRDNRTSPSRRISTSLREGSSSSPPRRNYGLSSQSVLHKSESILSLSGRSHHGRCGSPIREGYDIESQALLRNTTAWNGMHEQEHEGPSVSPSRRGYDTTQSVLRKTESNTLSGSRGRDSRSSSPGRRGHETPTQYQLRKMDTSGSLHGRSRESRNSSPSRRGYESPSQSLLRKSEINSSVRTHDRHNSLPSRKSCHVPDQRSLQKTETTSSLNSKNHKSNNSSPSRKDNSDPPGYSILRNATNVDSSHSFPKTPTYYDSKSESNCSPFSLRESTHSQHSSSLSCAASPSKQTSRTSFVTLERPTSPSSTRSGIGRREDRRQSPNERSPSHRIRSPSPSPQIQMRRHTSSQSSMESSESGQQSVGSTGRNRDEYARLADVPKVKTIHQRKESGHIVRPQNQQPPRRQELFKPASHSLSKHPSREWDDTGDAERDCHYDGSGYLSRAHSTTALQRSGSPMADEGSYWKESHHRSGQIQPDLLNFKKGWMSKLDESGEWKKHWFVLTDAGLKYYRDSSAEEKDDVDGEIDLKSCVNVSEFDVEKNYGFQIQTREAAFTLSAMTAGIRRNWIEVLKKSIRPSSSPDLTQLPDSNSDKENSHSRFVHSSRRPSSRQADVQTEIPTSAPPAQRRFDYVELSPVPTSPGLLPASQREAGEGQGREHSQWQEERNTSSQWEAVLSRKGTGVGLNQKLRMEDEIEKKWSEFERMPLKEMKSMPPMGSRSSSQSANEALQREVASLRQQLEELQGGRGRGGGGGGRDGGGVRGGCGPEASCGRSLSAMERAHRQALEELQRQHDRQMKELESEKDRLLLEESQDTARVMEALKKKHKEELERETEKVKRLSSGVLDSQTLRVQQQAESQAFQRELARLSERYSQKCLELNRAEQNNAEREREISCKERDMEQLRKENLDLKARLKEEISRVQSTITDQRSEDSKDRTLCELQVLLRMKENEIEYLHKEISCLRNELQFLNTEKRLACERYTEMHDELSGMKGRSEREIQSLKEHLRLAMAALQEGQKLGNSLDH